MNLLIISNNLERPSFRQRIEIYIDYLKNRNIICRVEKLPESETARLKIFRKAKNFDAVFLHKKRLNPVDAFVLKRCSNKIIYDFDDAVMYDEDNPEKPSRKRAGDFARTVRIADIVIAGNKYLAQHAEKYNPNVEIITTGLDLKPYDIITKTESGGKIRLVWIGSKSTIKYLVELKPALEKIGSLFNNVVLRIITDDFFDLQNMEVEKFQWSLERQYSLLVSSDIGLAPLPNNSFTRGKCGFKILQYQAAGLPVVTSTVGVNLEFVDEGKTGLFANNTNQWIEKISLLVENENIRKQMGTEGKQHVQKFDCRLIAEKLCELIENSVR